MSIEQGLAPKVKQWTIGVMVEFLKRQVIVFFTVVNCYVHAISS